jgi:hypothetical protein
MRFFKQIALILTMLALAGSSFLATSAWLDKGVTGQQKTTARTASGEAGAKRSASTAATYCELSFPVDNCPAQPGAFPIGKDRLLRDTWEGADTSSDRCMRRANEYHAYCRFQGTVTARFFRDGRVAASRSVP